MVYGGQGAEVWKYRRDRGRDRERKKLEMDSVRLLKRQEGMEPRPMSLRKEKGHLSYGNQTGAGGGP